MALSGHLAGKIACHDMLLYLASPKSSITRILDICAAYGQASGYTINWSKSVLYLLCGPCPALPCNIDIQVTEEGFKYLGVYITHSQATFTTKNLIPALRRFRSDVAFWRTLPLTLLGRAALFKMKALPRFLYVLQNTPLIIDQKYLAAIDAEVTTLLWDGKANWIAMCKLVRGWYDGGIALPNIKAYYWASHLMTINQWLHAPQDEPAYRMDRHLLGHDQILRTLYNGLKGHNVTGPTKHTIILWHKAQRTLRWQGKLTQVTPLWCTRRLGNFCNTKGFRQWDLIGISRIGDIWGKGAVLPFDKLQQTYNLASTEHYRYIQIRHALTGAIPKGSKLPDASPLEDRLLTEHMTRKAISLTYKKIINNMPEPLGTLRNRWQADVGDLDDSEWQEALSSAKEIAIPPRLKLIQLKILHRVYYNCTLLHKLHKIDTPTCKRNCGMEGTYIHTLWHCPVIVIYWTNVMQIMSQVTVLHTPPEIKRCLLNVWDPTDLTHSDQDWVILGMALIKRNIARKWGAPLPPTLQEWCRDMDNAMMSKKSVYVHHGCPKKWAKIWGKWNKYRGYICEPPSEDSNSEDSS